MRKSNPRQLAYIQHLRKREGKDSLEMDEPTKFPGSLQDHYRTLTEKLNLQTNITTQERNSYNDYNIEAFFRASHIGLGVHEEKK